MKPCVLLPVAFAISVAGKCYEPNPAFPVPSWSHLAPQLHPVFESMSEHIQRIVSEERYDNSSYAVEVTSASSTLWSSFHTARQRNSTRPGVSRVDGTSQFRIGSITKLFTTLGVLYQHKAGNLSLDDPVTEYVAELLSADYILPWKDITLRALAGQLSGLPRDFAESDLLNLVPDPVKIGLPPAHAPKEDVPACEEYGGYRPCNATEMLEALKHALPLFAPNQKSTYSNINYNILGLVLENVTGLPYEEYITRSIFEPLGMKHSSLTTPSDDHAVLPMLRPDPLFSGAGGGRQKHFWDVNLGVQKPTGGIYSSSADMSRFLRYILTHYNTLAGGFNWLLPASWSTGMNSFTGAPFEIFRTDRILRPASQRPVTFATKSGGLPGYYSLVSLLEEYGLGLTVLVAGELSLVGRIQEALSVALVRAAENVVWGDVRARYAGSYHVVRSDSRLNSSLALVADEALGLVVTEFISNGSDVLSTLIPRLGAEAPRWHAQLVPTLLFIDEEKQRGEIWRVIAVNEREGDEERGVWDDFCITDVDMFRYVGRAVNEVVFWHNEETVELPAWEVTMRRQPQKQEDGKEKLVVQAGGSSFVQS